MLHDGRDARAGARELSAGPRRSESGTTAADVDRELQAGDPAVLAHIVDDALVVVVDSVSDEDDELLAERLAAAFS